MASPIFMLRFFQFVGAVLHRWREPTRLYRGSVRCSPFERSQEVLKMFVLGRQHDGTNCFGDNFMSRERHN